MEFRVLGKLEVVRDGAPIDLGAFRQRALLGLLLTAPNTVFSTDRLIDDLWGEGAGADKQGSLWVYVSGLRKVLEPDREKRSDGTVLLTRLPGYLVEVEPDGLDAARFEAMLAEGRSLLESDPAAASLVLGEALASWRGRAFEDFTYESWAQPEIARLEGLRLEAVELRIDADLRRGLSGELVSELETLVRQHPLREHLTGQLMVALYRSARQAEALRTFQQLRSRLGEELGIEPSASVRRLEEQIVTGDPALGADGRDLPAVGVRQPGLAVRGYELRERLGERGSGEIYRAFQPSVGREVAVKVIRPEIANDPGFIRRFESEAQLVARLEHPHVVPLYDYWREPDAAYLVMRLMRGGSLAELVERSALDTEQASRLVEQIGGALIAAHRSGVVHGDVTPENVLIDDEGNAYLSDFPIAVGAADRADDSTAGRRGEVTAVHVDPTADVRGLATVVAQALTGLAGDVAQIRGALSTAVRPVIDRAVDPSGEPMSVGAFVARLRAALGDAAATSPVVEIGNPYKGLRAFGRADAADFHGRERLVERLLARLGEPGVRGRFVAVVGPSGSGKSSVVRAGLLPAIRAGALPLSREWFVVETTPAPHPFEQLAEALLAVADSSATLVDLPFAEHGLQRAVHEVVPADGAQVVVVIDQFEELFTQVDEHTCDRFVDTLVDAIRDDQARIRVVVTLRADFYDRPLRHRGLGELLRDGTEVITPMSPEELERAITGPVAGSGITFERSLVGRLVHEVVDRPGALPLLQYTLTELFDGRSGPLVTEAGYDELGGVSGALVKRAENIYARLGDGAGDVARQVFLRLVTLGEGTDDTRRRVLRAELDQLPVDRRLLDRVLDAYARHRLLTFDRDPVTRGPTVEISHESLLDAWGRLRSWIDGARHDVRNQRRLADAMGEWVAADRSDGYLLRGGRLEQLHGWASTTTLPLAQAERHFLEASVAERDRVVDEQRERERRAAAAERRARRRVRQLVAVAIVAALVGAMAIYGAVQRRSAATANAERDQLLRSIEISADSVGMLDDDPELALLLAVEAVASTVDLGFATEEAVDAVHWALYELGVTYDIVDPNTPVAVRPGPDGLTGVWVIPPAELVDFALSATDRRLTDAECDDHFEDSCAADVAIPVDLPLLRGDAEYGAVRNGLQALAGTSVTMSGPGMDEGDQWMDVADPDLTSSIAAFSKMSGIAVGQETIGWAPRSALGRYYSDRLEVDVAAVEPRELPSIAHRATDLREYLDMGELRSDFTSYLLELASVAPDGTWPAPNGSLFGVPIDVDVEGLVFYSPTAFAEASYEVPETLDELLELSSRMVADGRTPWCFGFRSNRYAPERGPGAGTDLLESLVLRLEGPAIYDDWSRHRIPFDHPAIDRAAAYLRRILLEPGFVLGGNRSIASTDAVRGIESIVQRASGDGCWMQVHGSSAFIGAPSTVEIGTDLDFFVLPPAEIGEPAPVTGSVTYLAQVADRPEVRRFVQWITGESYGTARAAGTPGRFQSANVSFRLSSYGGGPPDEHRTRTKLGRTVRDALVDGRFRLDASDTMPAEIGAYDRRRGAFLQAMIDIVDGERTIEHALADVEAAWQELEAADEPP